MWIKYENVRWLYEEYEKGLSNINIGDPAKAVELIISVLKGDQPPFRLAVGSQAAYTIREAYTKRLEEVNTRFERTN
jgi:hypothetical protein